MAAAREAEVQPAMLTLSSDQSFAIERESDLIKAFEALSRLSSGQSAVLARGPHHYIKAVRHDDLWAVTTRKGGYFTLASFTAEMTTEYSDRAVKESRAAGWIWKRISRAISSPSPEHSLSTTQVRTLFSEFFLLKRFSIPQAGA
jgi:hypothetical protein